MDTPLPYFFMGQCFVLNKDSIMLVLIPWLFISTLSQGKNPPTFASDINIETERGFWFLKIIVIYLKGRKGDGETTSYPLVHLEMHRTARSGPGVRSSIQVSHIGSRIQVLNTLPLVASQVTYSRKLDMKWNGDSTQTL